MIAATCRAGNDVARASRKVPDSVSPEKMKPSGHSIADAQPDRVIRHILAVLAAARGG
ncbi:MAG TPA: hypothetical protein VM451_09285 [Candidatus Limnocylindria bacterium]|nr:hypothetical protein [Candidatus Limnocylindria bacterium]